MQYFYPEEQVLVAVYFFIVGAALCMLYDLFRIKRAILGSPNIVMLFDDLMYMTICTVCVVLGILKINSGNVRWYELFFAASGFVLYRVTLSRIIMSFFYLVLRMFRILCTKLVKVLKWVLRPVIVPIKKAMCLIYNNLSNVYTQFILNKYKICLMLRVKEVSFRI